MAKSKISKLRTTCNIKNDEILKDIQSMLYEKSNKEIGLIYNVSKEYIGNYLHRYGIKREKQKLKEKICSKCNKLKDITQYRKIKNRTAFRANCKDCERKWDHNYKKRNRLEINIKANNRYRSNLIKSMLNNARGRATKKGLLFNLDLKYLNELWRKCDKRCELSNIPFEMKVYNKPHPFRPSIDKIDNTKGYIKGNVRIILWGLNRAINDMGLEIYCKIAGGVLNNEAAVKFFGEYAVLNDIQKEKDYEKI